MLVESHTRYDTIADFDPRTGLLAPKQRPLERTEIPTDGWFDVLGGHKVVFYRMDGRLWLVVDSRRFDLDETIVKWRRRGKTSVLSIGGGSDGVRIKYEIHISGPRLSRDPTPFVEEEDWDLGLFIANVLSNPKRRQHVAGSGPAG